MSRIKIDRYSSTEYDDPSLNIFKQAIVVAWGTIDGVDHTYAEVQPSTDIGVVPREFVDDARNAFRRAMDRKDIKQQTEQYWRKWGPGSIRWVEKV